MDEVLQEIEPHITKDHLVVSIAAGYPISKLEKFLGSDKRIIRVMPNISAVVGGAASGYSLG